MDDQQRVLRMDAAGRTDVGEARRAAGLPDEDTVFLARFRDLADAAGVRALYAVADGVSQRKGGKVASAQAINMLEEGVEYYARRGESGIPGIDDLDSFLRYVFERIDQTLKSFAENNENIAGMGTTLTAAVIAGNEAKIVHAGDSRAYLLPAGGGITKLTEDHETTDESGEIVPSNGVGCITDAVRVDLKTVELHDGDVLLLCTDGLWREITDGEIERIVRDSASPAIAVDRLIRAANEHGGSGNIGVVVCHFGERVAREAAAAPAGERPEEAKEAPAPSPPVQRERAPTLGRGPATAAVRDRAAEASGQVVAFLLGVVVTIVAVLILWGVGRLVGRAMAHRAERAGAVETVEVPVWCWFDKQAPPPDRCTIEVASYEDSEQGWQPLQSDIETPVQAVVSELEGKTYLDVIFRVRLNRDPEAEEPKPLPTRFKLKLGTVPPPRRASEPQAQGKIIVIHDTPATVTLTLQGGGETLEQELRYIRGQGYRAVFDNLKFGRYILRGAGKEFDVPVTEQLPRRTIRLNADQPIPTTAATP